MCIPPVPITEDILAKYAAFLARRLRPNSVKQYINIVRIMHLEVGYENPAKDSFLLKTTLRGIERSLGTMVHRKTPITPHLLLFIKEKLNFRLELDCVFWAACLVMFCGLFRKSNLFSKNGFKRSDIFINNDGVLELKVTSSKTIQCRERALTVRLPPIHPHPLCPVRAVCDAFRVTAPKPGGAPAFPMGGDVFDKKLKTVLANSEGNFASHSFRRGGAVWCLTQKIPSEVIKLMGDWKSNVYMQYLDEIPHQVMDFYRLQCLTALPQCQ